MWRLKLLAARARRRLAGPQPDREEVVRRHAAGKTFCDVGCMWKVHGRIAFVAEEAGATAVTGRRRDGGDARVPRRARASLVEASGSCAATCTTRDRRRGRSARGRLVQRRPLPRAQPGAHAAAPARADDRAPDPPDDDAAGAAGRETGARLLPGRAQPAPVRALGRGRGQVAAATGAGRGSLRALVVGDLPLGAPRDAPRRPLRARRAVGRPLRRARHRAAVWDNPPSHGDQARPEAVDRSRRRPRRPAPVHRLRHRARAPLHRGGRPPAARGAPRRAGPVPVHARDPPGHVPQPQVDDAPVRGLRDRAGDERALPLPDQARLDRPVDGVRPARPSSGATRTTRCARARSAAPASRSTRSTTCAASSTASRSTRCRRR